MTPRTVLRPRHRFGNYCGAEIYGLEEERKKIFSHVIPSIACCLSSQPATSFLLLRNRIYKCGSDFVKNNFPPRQKLRLWPADANDVTKTLLASFIRPFRVCVREGSSSSSSSRLVHKGNCAPLRLRLFFPTQFAHSPRRTCLARSCSRGPSCPPWRRRRGRPSRARRRPSPRQRRTSSSA